MNRRGFLGRAGTVGAVGVAGLAGCLERLGFEEQSAWQRPPLVEDRPNAVYVPASAEDMATYGAATDGDYAVALSYTFPHRFWTVSGADRNEVSVGTDDTMHLMCHVRDAETGIVLPVDAEIELERDGESVYRFVPWPMLSQRMGFHYGDNVTLPAEGEYAARIRVGPVQSRRTGQFEGRFENAGGLEIDFEYARSDVHDLSFETIDRDRRGTRGALEPMDHGGHGDDSSGNHAGGGGRDGNHGSATASRDPAVEDLPGRHLGAEQSGDARISILETDRDRLAGDAEAAIAVFPRTPYNDIVLPFTELRATLVRDGEVVLEDRLRETLDHEFGHHYGIGVDALESGDRLTVSVRTPPNVSRHDGYETAFFDFEDVSVEV